jgi:Xaa-Pro aminopeptidase
VSSSSVVESQGLGQAKDRLRQYLFELEMADLCLVNRNNEQLFSTYSERENDLFSLIGFTGSSGILILRRSEVVLLVDQRYLESARQQYAKTFIKVEERNGKDWVVKYCLPWAERYRGRGGARCFIDKSHWAASEIKELKDALGMVRWKHKIFSVCPSISSIEHWAWPKNGDSENNLKKVQRVIKTNEIHLFTCPDDLSWLVGGRSNHFDYRRNIKAVACISKDEAICFATLEQAQQECFRRLQPDWTLVPDREAWPKGLKSLLKKMPRAKCVVPYHSRPGGLNEWDHEQLMSFLPEHQLDKAQRSLAELGRLEKSAWEQQKMLESQTKLAHLMTSVIDYIHHEIEAGRELRECQVLDRADSLATAMGAIRPCFPGIVASAEHTRHPHHVPTRRLIKKGEPVLLDLGYYFDEGLYATDMTRSLWSDRYSRPHPKVISVYSSVLKAFLRQFGYCAEQSEFRADRIDKLGRELLATRESEGYAFIHSTGHGVGISDHELGITIGPNSLLTLRPGYTYSLEPGLYRTLATSDKSLQFGIRLEDVVLVEGDASLCRHRSLGPAPFEKNLIDEQMLDDSEHFILDTYLRLAR